MLHDNRKLLGLNYASTVFFNDIDCNKTEMSIEYGGVILTGKNAYPSAALFTIKFTRISPGPY